jgi:hypothetical protein
MLRVGRICLSIVLLLFTTSAQAAHFVRFTIVGTDSFTDVSDWSFTWLSPKRPTPVIGTPLRSAYRYNVLIRNSSAGSFRSDILVQFVQTEFDGFGIFNIFVPDTGGLVWSGATGIWPGVDSWRGSEGHFATGTTQNPEFVLGTYRMGVHRLDFSGGGTLTISPSVVPEPASWALMIAGFGLVGSALRRRTVATA